MTWLILALLGVSVVAVAGGGGRGRTRKNRFRLPQLEKLKKKRKGKFKPFDPKGTRRGRKLRLDLLREPFAAGEGVGTVDTRTGEGAQIMSFDLGDVPAGPLTYIVDVEFSGPDAQGTGRYRAVIDQQKSTGWAEMVMGGVMPDYPMSVNLILPEKRELFGDELFLLAEYLIDPERGTVGRAGFSFEDGRLFFSIAGYTVGVGGMVDWLEPYDVEVKWRGYED